MSMNDEKINTYMYTVFLTYACTLDKNQVNNLDRLEPFKETFCSCFFFV